MNLRSTDRVSGFPSCTLFALIDTDAHLEGALRALEPHVDFGSVRLLTGDMGAHALDVSGGARGVRGRTMRAVQDVFFGRSSLHLHETHLRRGGHLLLIPARDWKQCQQLVNVLTEWRAHGLVWFARFSVVDATPRYCAVSGRVLTAA